MIHQPLRFAFLFACVVSSIVSPRNVIADDYVWARSNWGVMPGGTAVSKMSNGYGGYYVPRSAAGNNYEGSRFTNPNGFIIPAQAGTQPAPQLQQHRHFLYLFAAPAQQPTATPTIAAAPIPPISALMKPAVAQSARPTVTASTQPVAIPTLQTTQFQQP